MNFSFVQITDHHISDSEDSLIRGFSTVYSLRAVLRHIARNVGERIDFIVSTGDVTEHPTEAAYATFRNLTQLRARNKAPGPQSISAEGLLNCPIYFLPGNHDDRDLFFRYLAVDTTPMTLMNVLFEHKGVQFVCIDQGIAAKAVLLPETVEFLSKSLQNGRPSVVLMHHHPIPVGSRLLDSFIADDIGKFWAALRGQNVLGVLFGHVHTTYEGLVEGIPELGLRATSFQSVVLDEGGFSLESPHYRLVTIQDNILTSRVFEVIL